MKLSGEHNSSIEEKRWSASL